MTNKKIIIDYLEDEPLFRERSNKDRGIVNLLMRRYAGLKTAIDTGVITKEVLTSLVQDYASMDRVWRQTLEHNEHLRGSDYEDKEELERRKLEELGYQIPPTRP